MIFWGKQLCEKPSKTRGSSHSDVNLQECCSSGGKAKAILDSNKNLPGDLSIFQEPSVIQRRQQSETVLPFSKTSHDQNKYKAD